MLTLAHNLISVMKTISLGPTCISASIIQAMGLKTESYPLDWAQSGSEVVKELFMLDPIAFYWRHIFRPTLILHQQLDTRRLDPGELPTHSLIPSKVLYGYPWFYNPHADVNSHDRDYYLRCLRRFKLLVSDSTADVCCLLSDQPDIKSYDYLSIPSDAIKDFYSHIVRYVACNLKLVLLRIHKADTCYSDMSSIEVRPGKIWKISVSVPSLLYGTTAPVDRNYELQICASYLKNFLCTI